MSHSWGREGVSNYDANSHGSTLVCHLAQKLDIQSQIPAREKNIYHFDLLYQVRFCTVILVQKFIFFFDFIYVQYFLLMPSHDMSHICCAHFSSKTVIFD